MVLPTLWTVLDIHLSCQCCVSGRESGWFRQHCGLLDIHLSCQCCVSGRERGWFCEQYGLYWTYTSAVSAVCLGERVGGFANIVDCTGHTPQLSVLCFWEREWVVSRTMWTGHTYSRHESVDFISIKVIPTGIICNKYQLSAPLIERGIFFVFY